MAAFAPPVPPFRVLTVCTGNLCRSPAIEQLLRARLASAFPDAADWLEVSSAGTGAVVGEDVHPDTAAALAELGLPVTPHTARRLVSALVAEADLVLVATRAHRSAAAQAHPAAVGRVFTLLELARLAPAVAAETSLGALPPADRCRALVAEAKVLRGVVRPDRPEDDDLRDPITEGAQVHREVVGQADAAVREIVAALLG